MMNCKVLILFSILLIGIAHCQKEYKYWGWDDNNEKSNTKREAVEPRVMNRNDDFLALPSIEQQTIQEFRSSNATEASDEEVIEEILRSGRQGRNIEGLDDIYSDPIVKQALDNGDDNQARNLIRDKLCSLGLMQCDEVIAKRPAYPPTRIIYTQPPPGISSIGRPVYRPPQAPPKSPYAPHVKVPYGPPQPVPIPNGPPRKVGYAPNAVYTNKYGNSYDYEQQSSSAVKFGYTERPTIVVNQTPKIETAASNVQIHHHYHHVDGTKAADPPKTIVVNNPIPVQPIITSGIAAAQTVDYSALSSSYQQGATGSGFDSGFVPSSPDYDYKGVNSGSGYYAAQSANKPIVENNQYASQYSQGNYPSQTQASFSDLSGNSLYNQQQGLYSGPSGSGVQGSFHSSAPDFYKKELNINGPSKTNGLSSYNQYSNQNKYSQNSNQYNLGEKFLGSESARQDQFDCVCVPYNQCPATDIVGRRDDLILPLDPRNLPTEIEAESDTNNSTRVAKDVQSQNVTDTTEVKKISKRQVAPVQGEGRIFGFGGGNYGGGQYGQGGYPGGGKKVLPTVGVSFGLPFPNGQGYPINPYGNPVAPNPYFGSIGPNGLNLGLVNVNPLVSVQLTKNEHGEKLLKPLVNLHVTPNAGLISKVGSLFAYKKGGSGVHNHIHHHTHRYPPPPPIHYPGPHSIPFEHHGHGYHEGPISFSPPPPHGLDFHRQPHSLHGPPEPFHPDFHHGPPEFHGPPPPGGPIYGPPSGPPPGPIYGPPSGPPGPFFKDNSEISPSAPDHYDNFGIDFDPALSSFRNNANGSFFEDDEQLLQELKRNYNYQSVYPQNFDKFNNDNNNNAIDRNSQQHQKQQYANNYNNYNYNKPITSNNRFVTVPTQAPGDARGSKTVTFPNNRRKRDTDQIVPASIDSENKETLESVHDSDDSSEGRALSVGKRQSFYQPQGGRPPFAQNQVRQCGPSQVCCRRPIGVRAPHQQQQQQQYQPKCGVRNAQGINGRIKNPAYVDGDSEFGEYPWQAAILKKDAKESVYVCGGTLIDDQHIMTAAHCVKTYSGFDLRVRLGEWDVNHDVEFYPYVERDVISVHIHPEYYAGTLDNDLAILKLNQPVDIINAPHITPACLPDKFLDFTGARCWTTGWGKDSWDYGKYQNILKEVDVPIIGDAQCQAQLRQTRLGYSYKLNPGFICAGGEEGKDACKGDGGGPLVCERAGVWQVVGIVSWGIGCGQPNVPGVYVKVSHYLDWIQQLTRKF